LIKDKIAALQRPSWEGPRVAVDQSRIDRTSAMGATTWPDGTGFRTWAPDANSVAVVAGARLAAAQGGGWRPGQQDFLAPLGDGSWGGFLAGLRDGDPYMFFVDGAGSTGWKRDCFACELTNAPAFPGSYCVVRDPASYPWHDQGWQTPRFSDLSSTSSISARGGRKTIQARTCARRGVERFSTRHSGLGTCKALA
jgi:1,4-alpha-glucan branching enzyme